MSDAVCRHVQCTPIDQRHVKCTHIHISTPSLSPSTPNVRQPRGEWEWERKKGRQGASARKAGKARRKDRLEVCWRCLGSTGWRCLGSHCPATMALPAPVAQQQVCTLDEAGVHSRRPALLSSPRPTVLPLSAPVFSPSF